jgi:hypothetical protein
MEGLMVARYPTRTVMASTMMKINARMYPVQKIIKGARI